MMRFLWTLNPKREGSISPISKLFVSSFVSAIKAIEKLNHSLLCGMPIRVMWSHRDLDSKIIGIGNVFVENLSESTDTMKLQAIFGKFGNILSSKVVIENWKGNGYGFVQFDSQDSANDAINNLNDTIIDGKKICVGNFTKNSERLLRKLEAKCTSLYLHNLDQDITADHILVKFSVFGNIISVMIARDVEGNSKGFGFVNFETPESAKKALEALNQLHQRLNSGSPNLYVKNIDHSVDDNALREHFSQCGTITSAKVMRNEKGINKGFGFVCYSTSEEAIRAVNTLHGYMFHGKPLYVSIAQRKEERREQLQVQYAQQVAGFASSEANVISTGHPQLYHSPSGVMSQIPPPQGLMHQPFELRSERQPAGFVPPAIPTFQPMPPPVFPNTPRQQWQNRGRKNVESLFQSGKTKKIPNTPIQQRQNRGRLNGHSLSQSGQTMPCMPQLQQPNHSSNSLKDYYSQQPKYLKNGRQADLSNVSPALYASTKAQGMLAAAPLQQHKQRLGECPLQLVQELMADLDALFKSMLLEVDKIDLLYAKVAETVQMRKRQNMGRMNGHFQMQQPKKTKYLSIGRQSYLNNVSPALSASAKPQGMEKPNSMLATAPLQQKKQMLGNPLLQLVQADLAFTFKSMFLEVDRIDLLLRKWKELFKCGRPKFGPNVPNLR